MAIRTCRGVRKTRRKSRAPIGPGVATIRCCRYAGRCAAVSPPVEASMIAGDNTARRALACSTVVPGEAPREIQPLPAGALDVAPVEPRARAKRDRDIEACADVDARERPRADADHREDILADEESVAHRGGRPRELAPPEAIAQHGDRRTAPLIVAARDQASRGRHDPERAEKLALTIRTWMRSVPAPRVNWSGSGACHANAPARTSC